MGFVGLDGGGGIGLLGGEDAVDERFDCLLLLINLISAIWCLRFGDGHLDVLVFDWHAAFEDVRDFDVFIHFRPVQHSSVRADLEMGSLLTASVCQPREAAKGNGDAATIAQTNDKLLIPDHHTCRESRAFIWFTG